MEWKSGELFEVKVSKMVKKPRKSSYIKRAFTQQIPVQYAQLVHQFHLEDKHSFIDTGHESLRWMAYARHVLNEFGKELDLFRGEEEDFWSKVLNLILQRQLHGLSDTYAPPIASQISTSG